MSRLNVVFISGSTFSKSLVLRPKRIDRNLYFVTFIVFVGIEDADTIVDIEVDFPQASFVTVLRWKKVWLLVTRCRVEIPFIALIVCLLASIHLNPLTGPRLFLQSSHDSGSTN